MSSHASCRFVLAAIAAIIIAAPQTVSASSSVFGSFGNLTADLFAPTAELTSIPTVDDAGKTDDASRASRLESKEEPAAMAVAPKEPQFRSPTVRPEPAQISRRSRIDTDIEVSDLRNHALRRPPALLPLYVTFATLQMLDAHSTSQGLRNGAVEANPVVAPFAGNTGALYATKIAATAATIYLGEKLWRKNRFMAIVTMIAVNSTYAYVVQHN